MLTQARLKQLFKYDPLTGLFLRLVTTNSRAVAGTLAGTVDGKGYLHIRIDGEIYRCHRLAWLYVYGEFPEDSIDHINLNRTDNRICNLRKASDTENKYNRNCLSTSKSGVKGVSWSASRKKWVAQISDNNCTIYLGRYSTIEGAKAAYDAAAKKMHREYFRGA